jgi:type IV pilus assembly protein PilM
VVDWKKDIKLSDLLARDKSGEDAGDAKPSGEEPFRPEPEAEAKPRHDAEAAHEEPVKVEPEATEGDDAEKTPFWKREIKFGRQDEASEQGVEPEAPAEDAGKRRFFNRDFRSDRTQEEPSSDAGVDAPEAETTGTPFWKREVTFGRRTSDTVRDPDYDTSVDEPVQPFWKRELSFGRRKEDAWPPAVEAVAEDPQHDEHESTEPAAEPDVAPKTPFWKRELNFGSRREDSAEEQPVDAMEAPEQPEPDTAVQSGEDRPEHTPFWKRRLSFGRAKDPDFDAPEAERRPFFELAMPFRRSSNTAPDARKPQEKRSFFNRDFSFRRSTDSDFDTPRETRERKPFFKRELSFRRDRSSARGVTGGHTTKGGRKKQVIGLKVGASQIAAARIVNNGSPELVQLARQTIEQGIVVGGELRDVHALADALREFFARHKLPNRNVRLGIGNNRIGVRSFEISGIHDPKQLENAIRFRAQEALPIPLDEAVLDYHVIDEAVSPTGIRTYRVLLVVAYRELIDRYVAACRGAGLRLVGIDLEAFALLRALSPPESEGLPEDTALVAVAIGHDRSTFAVSTGTVCEFTRVLDWGGSSLNTAIARALDMTPSEAEPVKRTLSLSEGEGAAASGNEHAARAEEAVRLELQSFARELVSSLHFYQNQPGSLAIGTIVLTGGTAHLPGLAAELQRLIGVKVRVGDPLRRLKTAKRVEAPDQVGSMAVAIGLGIED